VGKLLLHTSNCHGEHSRTNYIGIREAYFSIL